MKNRLPVILIGLCILIFLFHQPKTNILLPRSFGTQSGNRSSITDGRSLNSDKNLFVSNDDQRNNPKNTVTKNSNIELSQNKNGIEKNLNGVSDFPIDQTSEIGNLQKTYVWICCGPGAKSHHSDSSCYLIHQCSRKIRRVTLEEAIKNEDRADPCDRCYGLN